MLHHLPNEKAANIMSAAHLSKSKSITILHKKSASDLLVALMLTIRITQVKSAVKYDT